MKAITLTQPWATLVAIGAKRIETRGWSTSYRGPLAIHAAKSFPGFAKDLAQNSAIFRRALGFPEPPRPITQEWLDAIKLYPDRTSRQHEQRLWRLVATTEGPSSRKRRSWTVGMGAAGRMQSVRAAIDPRREFRCTQGSLILALSMLLMRRRLAKRRVLAEQGTLKAVRP